MLLQMTGKGLIIRVTSVTTTAQCLFGDDWYGYGIAR